MLVGWSNFKEIVAKLVQPGRYAVDCETTGLRWAHGDELFSIIIATEDEQFYFNFQPYDEDGYREGEEFCLDRTFLALLKPVFANPHSCWYAHNAKFDLHMLANAGLEIAGEVHCTKAQGLVQYNEHMSYSLAASLERLGEKKDDAVEEYVAAQGLSRKVAVPGKKQRVTLKDYTRVPPAIMVPYGCQDARGTRILGTHQESELARLAAQMPERLPTVLNVHRNERRLTKTAWLMERRGLYADVPYCKRAADYELGRQTDLAREFKALTGEEYKNSAKLFERVFADQRDLWEYTDKGNPSFEGDTLKLFDSPAAKIVVGIRDAKAKADFYNGFIYHADRNGWIHPNLNQDGAGHGRFSSSDPNMQNLKKDKGEALEKAEFVVRRAIIPPPGYVIFASDADQMEYRLLMDQANEERIIELMLKHGLDPHEATAQLAGGLSRDDAKRVNFGLIYGQGEALLAKNLRVPRAKARDIKYTVLGALPRVAEWTAQVQATAAKRGWVFNWYGRRCHFPDSRWAYRAVNYVIAGGCADIVKIGLNEVEAYMRARKLKSTLNWNVHDENIYYIHESEFTPELVHDIRTIEQRAYPHRKLPLTWGAEWSDRSLADKKEYEAVEATA